MEEIQQEMTSSGQERSERRRSRRSRSRRSQSEHSHSEYSQSEHSRSERSHSEYSSHEHSRSEQGYSEHSSSGQSHSEHSTSEHSSSEHRHSEHRPSDTTMHIDVDCLMRDILRQLLFVILAGCAGAMLMCAYVHVQYVPRYTTVTTFAIGKTGFSNNLVYENLTSAEATTAEYNHVVNSNILKKRVCEELGLDSFDAETTVSTVESSNLMTLTVVSSSPENAYRISKSINEVALDLMARYSNEVVIKVISAPSVPMGPSNSMETRKYMQYGALVGALLVLALTSLLSVRKDTIKSQKDISRKLDTRMLGLLYHERAAKTLSQRLHKKKKSILLTEPLLSFQYVEAVRLLASRINIYMTHDHFQTLMITSVSENEGKSTVAANLAIALAQEGFSVVLMDCDFRSPAQYKIFEIPDTGEKDFTEAIADHEMPAFHEVKDVENLHLVLSRKSKRHPWDKDSAAYLKQLIAALKEKVDYVVIDTAPMALVSDTEEYAQMAEATMLVVRQDVIEAPYINEAIDVLNSSDTKLLGCTFNNVHSQLAERLGVYGRYGYGYYGYGRYGSHKKSSSNEKRE